MRQLILSIIVIASTSCNLVTQSKSEQAIIIAPETKPSNFETNDSSFLKLKIREDKFEIDFLKKVSVIDNMNNLDTFFQNNKTLINPEKVVVTGFDTSGQNKDLKDLLLKYGISKFRVNVEEIH